MTQPMQRLVHSQQYDIAVHVEDAERSLRTGDGRTLGWLTDKANSADTWLLTNGAHMLRLMNVVGPSGWPVPALLVLDAQRTVASAGQAGLELVSPTQVPGRHPRLDTAALAWLATEQAKVDQDEIAAQSGWGWGDITLEVVDGPTRVLSADGRLVARLSRDARLDDVFVMGNAHWMLGVLGALAQIEPGSILPRSLELAAMQATTSAIQSGIDVIGLSETHDDGYRPALDAGRAAEFDAREAELVVEWQATRARSGRMD